MPDQGPPVVGFRTGLGLRAGLIALSLPVIVTALAVAAALDQGGFPPEVPFVLGIAGVQSLVIIVLVVVAAPSHRWDLIRGRVTVGRREVALDSLTRVVVFPSPRGWVGMSFWSGDMRIPRLGADVAFGNRRALGRDQWLALRTLLAAPHAPALQAYAGVTQRRMATAPPLRSLAGDPAVRLVDAQIAWIDAGRRSTHPGSPVQRWAGGR